MIESRKEIQISDVRSVLSSIADPACLTACWHDPSDAFFVAGMELSRSIRAHVDQHGLRNIRPLFRDLVHHVHALAEEFEPVARAAGYKVQAGPGATLPMPVEAGRKYSPQTHIDNDRIALFCSFNEYMGGTKVIARRDAGEMSAQRRLFPRADLTKAIEMPGISVYAMKIGHQPHRHPDGVPDKNGCRILTRTTFEPIEQQVIAPSV